MGSSPSAPPPSAAFVAAFLGQAGAGRTLTFAEFMALALYHPDVGYYRQNRPRVGYGPGTDFYTASTSGPIFGELVAAAAAKLLRDAGRDPALHTFVEIGAETDSGILRAVTHPFAAAQTVRVGETAALAGPCVVFSNELFDAQPCRRTEFRGGQWREWGVQWDGTALAEILLDGVVDPPSGIAAPFPEGYRFDRPEAATALARTLAGQPWTGLFLAFDYGKTLAQLAAETPAGTVRAYFRHTQSNAVLDQPGEQDLTCHICWDWLADALRTAGFAEPRLDSQEAFLIRQAGEHIAAVSRDEASRLSQRKLALMQLLHPGHLGQKFQVLHAVR